MGIYGESKGCSCLLRNADYELGYSKVIPIWMCLSCMCVYLCACANKCELKQEAAPIKKKNNLLDTVCQQFNETCWTHKSYNSGSYDNAVNVIKNDVYKLN